MGNTTRYVSVLRGVKVEGGDGTRERPWVSVQTAAGLVEPGDTIIVESGLYRGPLVIRTDDTTWLGQPDLSRLGLAVWRRWPAGWPWPFGRLRRPLVIAAPGVAAAIVVEAQGVTLSGIEAAVESPWATGG